MAQPIDRIVWAIDALQESPEADEILGRCASAIHALVDGKKVEVEPVYVVPPQRVNTPYEVLYPADGFYGGEAEAALSHKLEKFDVPGRLPPKVIDRPTLTTTASVKLLSEYAVDSGADLIVVGAHGRKGVSRLFFGSFAESLLLTSSIPVLAVGRSVEPVRAFERILFPTDLKPQSEAVFSQVLELARLVQATIYIYHLVSDPAPAPEPYLELARKAGVKVELDLERSELAESDAILAAARRHKVELIAMAGQSGVLASIFAGSSTRQVARASPYPVWILHLRPLARRRAA